MNPRDLLGLPLETALELLQGGEGWTVVETRSPRPREEGKRRVIRVREHTLVVGIFEDHPLRDQEQASQ